MARWWNLSRDSRRYDMRLQGKVALITGAGGGLGQAVAEACAREGAGLVAWGRDQGKLAALSARLKKEGASVHTAAFDLRSCAAIDEHVKQALERSEKIDILVNCAGMPFVGKLADATEEGFNDVFAVNIRAPYFITRKVVAHMIEKGIKGVILNVASVTGKSGASMASIYSASKAALIAMTQALSRELAPHGIRVNALCPGAMNTDMFHRDTLDVMAKSYNTTHDQLLKGMIGMIPLKRILEPREVAEYIIFLVSDLGAGITGQAPNIDCGLELH
jgi:NAD(P)-dependent dehydrogenase (short-subunit alcohol dehydrogenase family)